MRTPDGWYIPCIYQAYTKNTGSRCGAFLVIFSNIRETAFKGALVSANSLIVKS